MPWTPHAPSQQDPAATLTQAYQFWNAGNAAQAEQLCRQVLAAWPGQADALHLLGLIAHAYGNSELAIDYLRAACSAPRAPARFFSNLAEMCRRQGLLAEGERNGRQAVKLDPQNPDAWNNLGILQQESGKVAESIDSLNQALMLQPNNPNILNNLGNCWRLAGQIDQAERHYHSALQQNPEFAQAHNNLAALAAIQGHYEAGISHARAALDCEPQFVEAYLNLADIEQARGNIGEALRWLDTLQSFAADHVGALNARTVLLLQIGDITRAGETARRAAGLAPQNGVAQLRLADVLRTEGRADQALAAYRKAATLPGLHIEDAWLGQVNLLRQTGRHAEAHTCLAEARKRLPDAVRLLMLQLGSPASNTSSADSARLAALVATPGKLTPAVQMEAHFVLAQSLLAKGQASPALTHLEQGNRLKRASFNYDIGQLTRWLTDIAAAFPGKLQDTPLAADTPAPIFIVGMPCSGAGLVEQILCSHPLIASSGEHPALLQAIEQAGHYPQAVANWPEATWHDIGQAYLTTRPIPEAGQQRLLLDATPGNFIYAGAIARALPGARIIHCRRDPLDTCMDCFGTLFSDAQPYCYDLRELGLFYRAYQQLMTHWQSVLPDGCLIELDYATLCANPQAERQRLLAALGLQTGDSDLAPLSPLPAEPPVRWRLHAARLTPLLSALGEVHE